MLHSQSQRNTQLIETSCVEVLTQLRRGTLSPETFALCLYLAQNNAEWDLVLEEVLVQFGKKQAKMGTRLGWFCRWRIMERFKALVELRDEKGYSEREAEQCLDKVKKLSNECLKMQMRDPDYDLIVQSGFIYISSRFNF